MRQPDSPSAPPPPLHTPLMAALMLSQLRSHVRCQSGAIAGQCQTRWRNSGWDVILKGEGIGLYVNVPGIECKYTRSTVNPKLCGINKNIYIHIY